MSARSFLLALGLLLALALNALDPAGNDEEPAVPLPRVRGSEASEAGARPFSAYDTRPDPSIGTASPELVLPGPPIPRLAPREMLFAPRRQHGTHRLFEPRSWDPPAPSRQPEVVARPSAPPLPFRFVGRQWTDGKQDVFISAGDKVLAARVGEQLEGGFRIDAVEPSRILFTYLPLETPFQLQFGVSE